MKHRFGLFFGFIIVAIAVSRLGLPKFDGIPRLFYFEWNSDRLAQHIVDNHLPPEECKKLIFLPGPFRPQPGNEPQTLCVYMVARLTLDPSVCELLMPSAYGLHCVAEVIEDLEDYDERTTWCNAEKDMVRCYDFSDQERIPGVNFFVTSDDRHEVQEFSYDHCERILESSPARDWCYVGRYRYRQDIKACDQVISIAPKDSCLSTQAQETLNDALCEEVTDAVRRSACHVLVKAFRTKPQLRPTRMQ